MSAVLAGTMEEEEEGAGRYCAESRAWGEMALWCYYTNQSLCSLVCFDDEVLDSEQEGPVRVREEGQRRRECVRWDPQSAVISLTSYLGAFTPVAKLPLLT